MLLTARTTILSFNRKVSSKARQRQGVHLSSFMMHNIFWTHTGSMVRSNIQDEEFLTSNIKAPAEHKIP